MEKHELENEARSRSNNNPDTYVSCYPYSRRYSMANAAMASNRPSTAVVNQGYQHQSVPDDGDDEYETGNQHDTKIEIPSHHPPQYSPASDKSSDKKVKVSGKIFFLSLIIL